WAVRFNYAGRFIGTGLQLEGDINYVHSKKAYSYGNLGFANDIVFPNIKLGYSYYRTVAKNVDAEIGVRALRFNSFDLTSISFVGGVAKTWNDFYANFRTFLIFMGGNTYATAAVSARQYLNSTDYIGALFGIGNSPDDFSTNFQLPTFAGIATYNIGVSYQKVFLHRNTLGISAAWYNQRFDVSKYRNQYDIFLTFSRKF
ncbi:MAG: YaiO family outer membrane beta-barrel protein, partial [Bacteroidetes bacterium]